MMKNCPYCGKEIPKDFRYCGFCGEVLEESQIEKLESIDINEDRSSRRIVTTLFADLTNFTRAAEGLDPEIIYRAVSSTRCEHIFSLILH